MLNTRFEGYKIAREIKRSGASYSFKRPKKDSRGQLLKNEYEDDEIEVNGLYHEQNANIAIVTGETTLSRTKKIPMILCQFQDTTSILTGDVVVINEKSFKVTGIVNIQEWNIVGDIFLEVFDNGGNK